MYFVKLFAVIFVSGLLLSEVAVAKKKSLCHGENVETTRLFLQQLSDTRVIVKWRGESDKLCFGRKQNALKRLVYATTTEGNHKEAIIEGLKPRKTYYYSVGGASKAPQGQSFTTSPKKGRLPRDRNTRIWIVGDSGTGTDEQPTHQGEAAAVRDGVMQYIDEQDGEPIDLFLMLGDNAYLSGSDYSYQQGVFNLYGDLMRGVATWSTIGNHEMGAADIDLCLIADRNGVPIAPCGTVVPNLPGVSISSDPYSWREPTSVAPTRAPYLDIFSFPTNGEVGGVASGTEQYYSFDYGNIHVVNLDSQLSARDEVQLATMRQWLVDDLSANTQDWTIVMFHHPPYSKGHNHDSDETEHNMLDRPTWDMRNQFVPIFDDYGVDLVYSGHAHSYERSYYLNNHTGLSETYSHGEHAELVDGDVTKPASGQGEESYAQLSPTSWGIDNRVVYTVNGSSGKADSSAAPFEAWLLHPAHIVQAADTETPKRHGLAELGSVLVDVSKKSLTAKFIDVNGDVLDYFTITRGKSKRNRR